CQESLDLGRATGRDGQLATGTKRSGRTYSLAQGPASNAETS
ncbi:MAG: hypothetical protein AVDCRST_MAG59-4553, partial [uncultured Thermomicrobiales bacterium]